MSGEINDTIRLVATQVRGLLKQILGGRKDVTYVCVVTSTERAGSDADILTNITPESLVLLLREIADQFEGENVDYVGDDDDVKYRYH